MVTGKEAREAAAVGDGLEVEDGLDWSGDDAFQMFDGGQGVGAVFEDADGDGALRVADAVCEASPCAWGDEDVDGVSEFEGCVEVGGGE